MLYEPALLAIVSKTIVLGIHYSTSLWMLPASIAIYYGYGALQGLPQAIRSHIAATETSWLDSVTSYSTQMALNRKKRTVHLIYPFQRLLTTMLWCVQSLAAGANGENAIRLAVNASKPLANEHLVWICRT
jgi:hypothetical protein